MRRTVLSLSCLAICFLLSNTLLLGQCPPDLTAIFDGDPPDLELCLNDNEPELTFRGQNGNNPYLFTYNINGGADIILDSDPGAPNIESIDIPTNVAGIFTYTLTSVEDDDGCVEAVTGQSVTFTVLAAPEVTMPTTDETVDFCEGDSAPDISFSLSGASPFSVTYTIDGGSSTTVTNVTDPFVITSPVEGEYVITDVTDMNNCSTLNGFMSNSITVLENPAPDVTDPNSDETVEYCEGDSEPTISFTLSGTGPFDVTYTDGTTTFTPTGVSSPFAIGSAAPGVYEITSVTDANDCSTPMGYTSSSITVVENPLPDITLGVDGVDICADESTATVEISNSESGVEYQLLLGGSPFGSPVTSTGEDPLIISFTAPSSETTYTVEAMTPEGCTAILSDDAVTSIFPLPEVTDPSSNETENYCEGDDAPTISFTLSGQAPFDVTYTLDGSPTTVTNVLTNTLNISNAIEGTYIVTSITDDNGCSTAGSYMSASITVIENPTPEVTMPSSNETINYCEGDALPDVEFVINGSGPFSVTYTIDGSNPTVVTNVTGTLTITNAAEGEYVVTSVTDMNNCSTPGGFMSNSITVIEDPAPTPTIELTPDQTSFCEGEDFTLSISGLVGNSNDYSYSWTLADGTTSNNDLVAVLDAESADDGTYTLIVTDDDTSCSTEVSVDIEINPLPEVQTQINLYDGNGWNFETEVTVCEGTTLLGFAAHPVENDTWSWTGPDGFTANTRSFNLANITLAMEGTYNVTYIDANGCMDSGAIELTVDPLPTLTGIIKECSADLLTYDIEFTSNGTVTSTAGTVSGNMVLDIPVAILLVTLTAESSEGCLVTVDVDAPDCSCDPIEVPISDGDESVCVGEDNPTLSVTMPSGLSANWYLEQESGGSTLNMGDDVLSYTPVVSAPGIYNYWVEGLDPVSDCVSNTRTQVVFEIYDLPTVTLSQAGPVCIDALAFDLTGIPLGGVYSGNGITNSVNGTFNPANAGEGIHTITYTYTDANSCVNTDTKDIVVNPLPVVSIDDVDPICVNDEPIILQGNPGGTGGTFSGDGITDANNGTFDPSVAGVSTHTITYTYLDANSCTNTAELDIEVTPLADFTVNESPCASDLLSYNIVFTTNAIGIGSSHGSVDFPQNVITDIPANQTVIITVTSIDNCQYDIEFFAPDCDCEPIEKPTNNGDESICFGEDNPTLSVTTSGSDISANWYDQPNGGSALNDPNPTLTYLPTQNQPGDYTFFVEAIDVNSGCTSDLREIVQFSIYALPTPQITPDDASICEGEIVVLDAGAYEEYDWSDNSNGQTIDVMYPGGTYGVIVTDENDCTGADQVTVNPNPLPFVSAPNNDIVVEYCENDTPPNIEFTLSGTGPFNAEYSFNGGNPISGDVVNDKLIITAPAPGDYEVVSIEDALCGTLMGYSSNIITVVENPEPSFNIIKSPVNNDIVCEGEGFELETDLVGNGFVYNWETPVGNFNSESLSFSDVNDDDHTGTYFLTVTDNTATACSFVASYEVNVSVVEGFIETNTTINEICVGESITLIAEDVPGDNGVTWLNDIPTSQENDITVEVSPTETTTYNAILRNTNGCEREESITIVVNSLPDPMIESNLTSYCNGDDVILSTEESYSSYEWSTNESNEEITFDANSSNPTYFVTVTDENNCTEIDEIDLEIRLNPTVGISTDALNLPAGTTADFEAKDPETDPDCSVSNYEWYVDGVFQGTSDTPDFSYTFLVEGDIQVCVVLVDDCGCNSLPICQDMVIFENGQCLVSFKELDNLCLDQESTLVANPIPGTNDGANLPTEGFFIVEGLEINQNFKDNMIDVEVGDPGRRFIVRKVLFKDKPFANADKFLDSLIIEFKHPIEYNYQFYYDFGLCEKISGLRAALVQPTPSFTDIEFKDSACFGESPRIEFFLPDDFQNFRLIYGVNGDNSFSKDFNGGSNFIQFPPQTNPNVDLEIDLINLINFNAGEIISPTGCSSSDIDPSSIVIDILPELEYTVQDSCNDELTMVQYQLNFEGGTGDLTLNGQAVMNNEFETPFFESGQSQTYTLIDEGCEEENPELITLSSSCETCVPFESLVDVQEITVDGDQNICESDKVLFTLSKLPEISENQIIVYAVLSDPSQFYDESILILDSISINPIEFEFDINSAPEFEVGVEYFITAFIFTKQAAGFKADPTCPGLNPKSVTFYENPTAEIENLEDDFNICINEFDFQVGLANDVTSSTLSSNDPNVNITYIEGDTRALINVGEITSDQVTITLNQSNTYSTTTGSLTCSDETDLVLNVLDKVAPSKDSIIAWPGFMYSFIEEGLCYQWGLNDDILAGETDRFYIRNEALAEDDILWINVWDCDDDLLECVSTIYYNAIEPPKIEIDPNKEMDFNLYPNPNNGQFTLALDGPGIGQFEANVLNATGQNVKSISFTKEDIKHTQTISIEDFSSGLYILQVKGQNGESQLIKLLKY